MGVGKMGMNLLQLALHLSGGVHYSFLGMSVYRSLFL